MHIRRAEEKDVPILRLIYNDAVLHTTATFDVEEKTLEERLQWFRRYNDTHPLFVAVKDERVIGYCSLSPFREKEAYKRTVEISVYVHKEARSQGVARALVQHALTYAQMIGHHVVIAGITKGNDTSIRLHEHFGFTHAGTCREVGFKFNAWQDILFYELLLPL